MPNKIKLQCAQCDNKKTFYKTYTSIVKVKCDVYGNTTKGETLSKGKKDAEWCMEGHRCGKCSCVARSH